MSLLFRARLSERSVRLWLQVLGDLASHAPRERWSTMKQDLRYAVRSLLRAPAFSATVVATLALGIGANSVIFSAVDAILLRDAPVTDPDTVVDVYTSSGSTLHSRSSYPDYFDLRDSGTFASLAAYTDVPITMDANGQPEPVAGELVSGNYFEVLGITMAIGRGFAPDEDRIGAPVRAAVILHALWQRMFNADRSLIGRTIRLNSNSRVPRRRGAVPPHAEQRVLHRPGVRIDRVLVASLNLEARGYFEGGPRGPEARLAVYEEILSRVEALPGVVAASAARMTVLSGSARSTAVSTDGRPIEKDFRNALGVRANVVSHRYDVPCHSSSAEPVAHARGIARARR